MDVNAAVNAGVWVTISELARLKGVDKAAISRRVARFGAQGEEITRRGDRNSVLVNVAAYDRLVGQTGDIFRNQAAAPRPVETVAGSSSVPPPSTPLEADSSLARVQAMRVGYDAELKRLDLEARLGKLLPVADVTDAMTSCARAIVRVVDQLPTRADEMAAAVAKDGAAGARSALRLIARDLRATLEREMRLLETTSAGSRADEPTAEPPDDE